MVADSIDDLHPMANETNKLGHTWRLVSTKIPAFASGSDRGNARTLYNKWIVWVAIDLIDL